MATSVCSVMAKSSLKLINALYNYFLYNTTCTLDCLSKSSEVSWWNSGHQLLVIILTPYLNCIWLWYRPFVACYWGAISNLNVKNWRFSVNNDFSFIHKVVVCLQNTCNKAKKSYGLFYAAFSVFFWSLIKENVFCVVHKYIFWVNPNLCTSAWENGQIIALWTAR